VTGSVSAATSAEVSLVVTNAGAAGSLPGREVVQVGRPCNACSLAVGEREGSHTLPTPSPCPGLQLYVAGAFPSDPPKALKKFEKTAPLTPGSSALVSFSLSALDLWWYDSAAGGYALYPPGDYAVYAGASSRDIRLMGSVHVDATT
jgi:hypothetical protein